ncbi:30S ribosomal protein S4 [Candidatus Pacearchaeota archaeon]|nr:30S ribosomal protein S4 [Candidatus Pacearchaeota archaeon]
MIRKKKLFTRPKKLYQAARIKEENILLEKYGLKNKKEIWKTLAKINYYRSRAKALSKAPIDEQKKLFEKLQYIGLKVNSIADVLALKIDDLLRRRLPSIVAKKGLAKTPQQARQMVVHKKVQVSGKVVNVPSYIVSIEEENSIMAQTPKPQSDNKNQIEGAAQ